MILSAQTLQSVWPMMVKRIMKHGDEVEDERGSKTMELLNLVAVVDDPIRSEKPPGSEFGKKSIDEYKNEMMDPARKGFVYTYGNRFGRYWVRKNGETGNVEMVDQLELMVQHLKDNPTSRRAVGVTWDPANDPYNDEVPCCNHIQCILRDQTLYTTGLWRSHDIYGAYPANFFALLEVAKYVSGALKAAVGPITTYSNSAHIYEVNWPAAKKVYKVGKINY